LEKIKEPEVFGFLSNCNSKEYSQNEGCMLTPKWGVGFAAF
jgi:hypothetical protein